MFDYLVRFIVPHVQRLRGGNCDYDSRKISGVQCAFKKLAGKIKMFPRSAAKTVIQKNQGNTF